MSIGIVRIDSQTGALKCGIRYFAAMTYHPGRQYAQVIADLSIFNTVLYRTPDSIVTYTVDRYTNSANSFIINQSEINLLESHGSDWNAESRAK